MKNKLLILIAALAMVVGFSTVSWAASQNVTVSLPSFPVTLNGTVINNSNNQYPLIVYKDITYFPMTYNDCRYLGIETEWKDSKTGLFIETTEVSAAYNPYIQSAVNGKSYSASVTQFPITVNGEKINNNSEEYPLLTFRDVTYFPMTWKWGHDVFNWDYSFDEKKGLVIKSDNMQVSKTAALPDITKFNSWQTTLGVTVLKGNVYYQNNNGKIVKAPLSDVTKGKNTYDLPYDENTDNTYVNSELRNVDGIPLLSYHIGGQTTGTDWKIQLLDSGNRTIQTLSWETTAIGDVIYRFIEGNYGNPGTLESVSINGGSHYNGIGNLGNEDYWYRSLSKYDGALEVVGKNLYIGAAKSDGQFKVTRVDTGTGKHKVLGSNPMGVAVMEDDFIYYSSGKDFYRVDVDNITEESLGSHPENKDMAFLTVLMGRVYAAAEGGELYDVNNGRYINKGGIVDSLKIVGDGEGYDKFVACTFTADAPSAYKFILIDKAGEIVFRTSDKTFADNVVVEGNKLYYFHKGLNCICTVNL